MTDQTLTRDELMAYSKRHLADTILSHIPHLDLLRGELARAEIRAAKLEEQLHELRAYADHADWCERQVLALCDVTEERGMPGECWVIAKEIRDVYGHAPTKPAVDLERPADAPTPLGAATGGEQP